MANPYFKFKKFTVFHDLCAMKVGVDAVLLGSWCSVEQAEAILDVGTGSGIIALMLAQRNSTAFIEAIDIEESAVAQAQKNFENSPWKERIALEQMAFQEFAKKSSKRYDLIVSNPPFFVDSLKAPAASRSSARHADSLSHQDLILFSKSLLKQSGKLCFILPIKEGEACIEFAETKGFFCERKVFVFPKPQAEAKRLLVQLSLENSSCVSTELTIETDQRHTYTDEFAALARDFYLKL